LGRVEYIWTLYFWAK